MTVAVRVFTGSGPLGSAHAIDELRRAVTDAAIEWALAEREVGPARARFDGATDRMRNAAGDDARAVELSRVAGRYLDTERREHDAMTRWKDAARALVEALERMPK